MRRQWRAREWLEYCLSSNAKMVDTISTFGFELLQKLCDDQIVKKEDVIILFVHWYFIKNGFRCLGLGDSKAYDASDRGTELLPEGWNTRPNYALRYVHDGKLYILHGIKSDEDLLLNLMRVDDQSISNTQFPIGQTVTDLHGPLESLIPSYQNVLNAIRTNLVDPILPGNTAETSTQTAATSRDADQSTHADYDPLRVGSTTRSAPAIHPWLNRQNPQSDPLRVGVSDLNPFARGGGMLYDPFSPSVYNPLEPHRPGLGVPGRLPPGAVPPGARFDPFGPPDVNPRRPPRDPDNDHLPPPGYDDMFM